MELRSGQKVQLPLLWSRKSVRLTLGLFWSEYGDVSSRNDRSATGPSAIIDTSRVVRDSCKTIVNVQRVFGQGYSLSAYVPGDAWHGFAHLGKCPILLTVTCKKNMSSRLTGGPSRAGVPFPFAAHHAFLKLVRHGRGRGRSFRRLCGVVLTGTGWRLDELRTSLTFSQVPSTLFQYNHELLKGRVYCRAVQGDTHRVLVQTSSNHAYPRSSDRTSYLAPCGHFWSVLTFYFFLLYTVLT